MMLDMTNTIFVICQDECNKELQQIQKQNDIYNTKGHRKDAD